MIFSFKNSNLNKLWISRFYSDLKVVLAKKFQTCNKIFQFNMLRIPRLAAITQAYKGLTFPQSATIILSICFSNEFNYCTAPVVD